MRQPMGSCTLWPAWNTQIQAGLSGPFGLRTFRSFARREIEAPRGASSISGHPYIWLGSDKRRFPGIRSEGAASLIRDPDSRLHSRGTSRRVGCLAPQHATPTVPRRPGNGAFKRSAQRSLRYHPSADAVAGDVGCVHAGRAPAVLKITAIESRCNRRLLRCPDDRPRERRRRL